MRRRLARLLRQAAARLDPPITLTPGHWPHNITASSGARVTFGPFSSGRR